MRPRGRITAALVGLVVLVIVGWLVTETRSPGSNSPTPTSADGTYFPTPTVEGPTTTAPTTDAGGTVALSALPPQARETYELVEDGGPYPYSQDDRTFGNREGLLPPRPDGYYREYTVPTPGEGDRGARRLVVGRDGDVWWTADHYDSFTPVDPAR